MKANAVDAGKFNKERISMWMPKVTPSLEVQTELEAKLVSGYIKNLYFEQVRVYRTMFQVKGNYPNVENNYTSR